MSAFQTAIFKTRGTIYRNEFKGVQKWEKVGNQRARLSYPNRLLQSEPFSAASAVPTGFLNRKCSYEAGTSDLPSSPAGPPWDPDPREVGALRFLTQLQC